MPRLPWQLLAVRATTSIAKSPMYSLDETIVAVASAPGGAAQGVIRLSGHGIRNCLEGVFRPQPYVHLAGIAAPTAVPGLLWLPGVASPLPCDLYLWPGPRSYTGQPVAEIHTLGSPPLLEAAVDAIRKGGARLAEPGEFTLRAFLAGRIDLTQAEAVLGVIDAADARQLHTALEQLAGGLAAPLHRLRDELLEMLAHLEAGLDFADEDLPFVTAEELDRQLAAAGDEVQRMLAQMQSRGLDVDLMRVAIVGLPNTGKSSLFNALARQSALVSDLPGTTRDYLAAELDLDGVKCLLVDTAGVQAETDGQRRRQDAGTAEPPAADGLSLHGDGLDIESAAQMAARQQRRQSYVHVLCIDATRPIEAWEREELEGAGEVTRVVVLTKCDALRATAPAAAAEAIRTSSVTGEGIDGLRAVLRDAVLGVGLPGCDVVPGTAARCRQSLEAAEAALQRAREVHHGRGGEELVAAEVRAALDELGKVVGAVYTEDLLQRIFRKFCVGK